MTTFPNKMQKIGSSTCGPLCLLNIYNHLGVETTLEKILKDLKINDSKATYITQLSGHVQKMGLKAVLLMSNPFIISPEWKDLPRKNIIEKLGKWLVYSKSLKSKSDTQVRSLKNAEYLVSYLKNGGDLRIVDLTTKLMDDFLDRRYILLSCLEQSWLWEKRKIKNKAEFDDIKGQARGHFVVVYGQSGSDYKVSDPYPTGLPGKEGLYEINKDKFLVSSLFWNSSILAIKR